MDNLKYVRVDNIYQRLTQRLGGREFPFEDIVEWCAECELIEIGQFTDWFRFQDVKIENIIDRQVALPENCWYLKNVKIDTSLYAKYIKFYLNGEYINLEQDYDTIYIDYYAFPTDTVTGYLIIPRGHENACFWYCMKSILLEDWLEGKIDQNRWNTIQREYEMAVEKAVAQAQRISDNERAEVLDATRIIARNYNDPTRR